MKIRLLLISLLVALSALSASAQEAVKDQAKCFTTWDDAYLYVAVKVDSPDIVASHSKPNQPLGDDDSVSIYLEAVGKRPEKIDVNCSSMSVSPAGGAQFCVGTAAGTLEPKNVWTFKYGMSVQGTISNADDIDMGYSIEMAIPWELMKAPKPEPGNMLSFDVVIRRHNGGFVSASPKVKTEADLLCPAKWSKLVLAPYSFAAATTDIEKIVSAKYMVRAPLINGVINDKEWHTNTAFAMSLPMPEGVVYEARFPAQRTTLAPYYFWYTSDSRRGEPGSRPASDYVRLSNFPIRNAGPWSSYDRTQANKEELSDMVAAGIDVVTPSFAGDTDSVKGLVSLVSAIDELKAEGKPYPRIGLDGLLAAKAPAQQGQAASYARIREFFDWVPMEYRAIAQAGKPKSGEMANVIHADSPTSSLSEYCRTSFEKDFGCTLMFAGEGSSEVRVSRATPGSDISRLAQAASDIESRMGGATYEKSWTATYEQKPNWIICDSWNNLSAGNELCATREYGRKYVDATAANTRRFKGNLDFDAQYVRYNVPSVIPAQQFAMAEFEIRNIGNSAWRTSDGYAVGYRWYRGGRYYGESKIRRPLERDVMPGDSITVTVGIATVNAQGAAMPEGPCEARIELMRLSDNKWFSTLGDQPLVIPITIGQTPEWASSWVAGHAPAMMAAGQTYRAAFRVRNDGSQIWPKAVSKLGCKLYKISSVGGNAELVPTKEISAVLAKDCKPGEIADFYLEMNLTGADKKPVAAWKPGDDWTYQLAFDVYNGQKWLSELGAKQLSQNVAVLENDYGPRIVDCDLRPGLKAGQTLETKVVLRNTGTQLWDKKRVKLGYHWYHLDGSEMLWDGLTTPIPANVPVGAPIVMSAKVTAPTYDGQYVLVWDVMVDGVWQSTQPLCRGGDMLPVFVEVTDGKLKFADLSGLCDISAASPETDMTTGDFDGNGSSFPAEVIPPDASVSGEANRLYPSGYRQILDNFPEGRISFCYPAKTPGAKNAVACDGQKIAVEKGAYKAIHILGASSDGDAAGDLVLTYADGDQPAKLQMSDWGGQPAHGEKIGLISRHRHSNGGDQPEKSCALFHYTIALDTTKTLTGLTLPKNTKMKVVAVTVEKP